MVKTLRRILLWTFLLVATALGGGWWYALSHEKELINWAIEKANNQLNTKVDVGEVGLSWEQFPAMSIKFTKLYCPGTLPEVTDTLFALDQAFITFDFWSLFGDSPSLTGVVLEGGKVHVAWDIDGKDNYHIWKEDTTTSGNKDLSALRAKNLQLRISYQPTAFYCSGRTEELNWEVSQNKWEGSLVVDRLEAARQSFSPALAGNFSFAIEQDKDNVSLKDGHWNSNDVQVDFHLLIGDEVNVQAHLQQISPAAIKAWYPELAWTWSAATSAAVRYSSKDQTLAGSLSWQKGRVTSKQFEFNADPGSAKFHYPLNRPESFSVSSQSVSGQWGNALVGVKGTVSDLNAPLLDIDFDLQGPVAELFKQFQIGMKLDQGNVQLSGHLSHRIPKHATSGSWAKAEWKGSGTLRDVRFAPEPTAKTWTNLNAQFALSGNTLNVEQLQFNVGKSDVYLKGVVHNLVPWMLDSAMHLAVDARLRSQELLMDDLLSTSKGSGEVQLRFLNRLDLDLLLEVEKYRYNKFTAKAVRGHFSTRNGSALANNLSMHVFGGQAQGNLKLTPIGNQWKWEAEASGNNLKLEELFRQFNNFGQQTLTSNELEGTANTQIRLTAPLNQQLQINPNAMEATAQITLIKGRLHNFKPMENLSRFAEMEELRDVRFDQLTNTLEISGGKINIPEMKITSNVVDLNLLGVHAFDNTINYRVKLKLRDVLGKQKKKKKNSELDEFIVEKERSGQPYIWAKITGTTENPEVALDRELTGKSIGDEWKKQGGELKKIFGSEGAPPSEQEKKKASPGFIFEWEEENDTTKR